MINFYFFHIGDNISLPKMMVESIRITNVNSQIFQITDRFSPEIKNIDKCFRFDGNIKNIMKFRMEAYSNVELVDNVPALFLDTDMLILKKINHIDLFKKYEVVLCKREIEVDLKVNINFKKMNMVEYKNSTMVEAWPYLGCFIAIKNSKCLNQMNEIYNKLETKYKIWYGDQIALKKFADFNYVDCVGENEYAYIPNNIKVPENAKILHFKGESLKNLMKEYFINYFK